MHSADLRVCIQAFAEPDALGVIAVEGVPELQQRRGRLLPLAAQLAGLGDANLERYVVPATKYNIGWSRGKESTQPGERDLLKGSFYANPVVNGALGSSRACCA